MLNLLHTSLYFSSGIDASDLIIKDQKELDAFIDRLHTLKKKHPFVLIQPHVSFEYARKHFSDPIRKDIPCVMGYLKIYMGPHGEVYPGCWALKPIGNLKERKLKEIISSEEYENRVYEMFMKKCPGCTCGYIINLIHHLPSICGEMLYLCRIKK